MATTLDLTTSYVGEAAAEFIHKCFLASATIREPAVTIKENVYGSWKIRRIATADILAAETCDFTPAGTVTLDERDLTTVPVEVNLQLCKTDFLSDWGTARMGKGANSKRLPPEVANGMIDEILASMGESIETEIWNGDGTLIDGYVPLMLLDAAVIDVPYAGAVITAANVLDIMAAVYLAWSATKCFGAPDQIMYVARNVAAAYQSALGAVNTDQGYLTQSVVGEKPWNYLGIPIFITPGMPAETIVCTKKSNLFVGTDSIADSNEVILKDMTPIDLSNNVRFRAGFHLGVNYGWSDEVVLAEPTLV